MFHRFLVLTTISAFLLLSRRPPFTLSIIRLTISLRPQVIRFDETFT